jgi:hypothetical protein
MGILILFDCEIQMNTFTVHKVCQEGTRQLLLIRVSDYEFNLAVYDEHSGDTLMHMSKCTLEQFAQAIELLRYAQQV